MQTRSCDRCNWHSSACPDQGVVRWTGDVAVYRHHGNDDARSCRRGSLIQLPLFKQFSSAIFKCASI